MVICNANSQDVTGNPSDNFYTMDFVFTGKIKPGLDSVFAVRCTFTKSYFNRFRKLFVADSHQIKFFNTGRSQPNDSIEIQEDNRFSYVIIKKYDKEDLPVLTQGEDKSGVRQELLIRHLDGNLMNAGQYKQMERANNDRIRQLKTNQR